MSHETLTRREALAAIALGLASACTSADAAPASDAYDVLIYGATPAGIAAAISAARLGRSVILVEREDHIGGIVSNGLTNADISKRQAVGGFFYEFTQRVLRHYQQSDPTGADAKRCKDGYWYEADVAERIFHEFLDEQKDRIQLRLSCELRSASVFHRPSVVVVNDNSPNASAHMVFFDAKVLIDATYEGDLAAAVEAAYRVGRESRAEFDEPHAGVVYTKLETAELLPDSTGEGDHAVQAYCFRFHVTDDPAIRVPIEKPDGFNRDDYRWELDDIGRGKAKRLRDIIQLYQMPGHGGHIYEVNSDHCHPDTGAPKESLDLAEDNWDWPENFFRRREIYRRYLTHNVGLLWLLQNDAEIPIAMKNDVLRFGWCKHLWPSNGHIPRQVYVREGRRIEGRYMLTEHDGDLEPVIGRTRIEPTSIGIVEWPFDSHACHKYDPAHPGVREGYTLVPHAPFQIPYGVIVPKTVNGLLVPVACSASHVAYNALRMEPVFMTLGQAAGIAAHLAVRDKVDVGKIPISELQRLLVQAKGVIAYYSDLQFDDPDFAAFQWFCARGLRPGYKADPDKIFTRREGAEQFAGVVPLQGKQWASLTDRPDDALTKGDLLTWLTQAGCAPEAAERGNDVTSKLTSRQFARMVFHALAQWK